MVNDKRDQNPCTYSSLERTDYEEEEEKGSSDIEVTFESKLYNRLTSRFSVTINSSVLYEKRNGI